MAQHRDTGKKGENIALDFLVRLGYDILEVNWSAQKAEIDIIARHNTALIFIEVKTRSHLQHGFPEEAVHLKKQKLIASAASQYMETIDYGGEVRFDIITIVFRSDTDFDIEHYKDAFFPVW